MVQMAEIIRRASETGMGSNSKITRVSSTGDSAAAAAAGGKGGAALKGGILGRYEDLMSVDELIDEFGLQGLLEEHNAAVQRVGAAGGGGGGGAGGAAAGVPAALSRAQLVLAATLHPEDKQELKLQAEQGELARWAHSGLAASLWRRRCELRAQWDDGQN